ncbi:MAG: hypothetical protein JWM64_1341 [Frankiales bacterium]|nr:hypothetical protein [Frankiales bacterium]
MNKAERALLLAWFVVVLAFLVLQVSLVFGVLGTAAGVFLGLPVARTAALRGRRKGTDLARRTGVSLQRVGSTIGAHLVLLLVVVLVAAVVPGLRDRFVAGVAALLTAGAATVTGARLGKQAG